jgi:predicted dehydrogenase
MKTYRVGIVGCGFIGKVHAYAHANLPYFFDGLPFRTRVTHVCTSRLETAVAAQSVTGADVATTDFREITENPEIDVVHICTPNHLHRRELLSAMAHGKNIYCDKPLVATADEAAEIESAAGSYTGTLQMTFQNRFFPSAMRARQIAQSGALGEILQFRAAFLHGGSANPDAPLKWKLQAAAGGGVVADLGSHVLDLVNTLVGDLAALNATTSIAYPDRPAPGDPSTRVPVDAEDCMLVLGRLANGAVGSIEATKLATGSEDELRVEIHGSTGALRYNSMDPHHLELYDADAPDRPLGGTRGWTRIDAGQRYPAPAGFPGPKLSIGWLRSHVQCLYEFLAAVHEGRVADPGLAQGIYIQRLMAAVLSSARERTWIAGPERPAL